MDPPERGAGSLQPASACFPQVSDAPVGTENPTQKFISTVRPACKRILKFFSLRHLGVRSVVRPSIANSSLNMRSWNGLDSYRYRGCLQGLSHWARETHVLYLLAFYREVGTGTSLCTQSMINKDITRYRAPRIFYHT